MNQKKDYVLRWIPKYSIIPLITALVLNTLVYSGTMVLCKGLYHHDFTTAFDRMVPVIPEFTSIYLICTMNKIKEMVVFLILFQL